MSLCDIIIQCLFGVAFIIITIVCLRVVKVLYVFGLSSIYKVDLKKKFGPWAAVTGCTEGIGKAYTIELAKRGLNLILISRNIDKLNHVASLVEEYGVETKIIVADFSSPPSIYEEIKGKLEGIDFGLFVNNAGIASETLTPFHKMDDSDVWDFTAINCLAPAYMSKIALSHMIKRGNGAIVNVSSVAGITPVPHLSIYSATKAFMRFFSICLHSKYSSQKIDIQNLSPGFVATRMVGYSKQLSNPSIMSPSPETYAASAVRTLTFSSNTTGYWAHELSTLINLLLPESIYSWCSQYLISSLKNSKGE